MNLLWPRSHMCFPTLVPPHPALCVHVHPLPHSPSAALALCCTCPLLHLPSAALALCCTCPLPHSPSAASFPLPSPFTFPPPLLFAHCSSTQVLLHPTPLTHPLQACGGTVPTHCSQHVSRKWVLQQQGLHWCRTTRRVLRWHMARVEVAAAVAGGCSGMH